MDEKHKELLLLHRSKFVLLVDVEHLIPCLEAEDVLRSEDTDEIRRQPTSTAKAEKLLDILTTKGGNRAFHSLCIALESSYPHLLTIMFLGGISSHNSNKVNSSDSNLTSIISDSELDEPEKDNFNLDPISLHHETGSINYGSQRLSRTFMTPSPQSMFAHEYEPQSDVALLKAELKLFAHEREAAAAAVRKEMHKTELQSRRQGSIVGGGGGGGGGGSGPGGGGGDSKMSSLGTLTKHGSGLAFEKDVSSVGGSDKALSSSRDYDRLKTQCDSAMRELQSLRRQHSETIRKCEMAMKESEFYRIQHKQALSKLDQQQSETLSLRAQYNEVMADKHRLEQEVSNLQKFREEDRKEVVELRRQQQEAMNENGNSEAINQLYITAMRKYEAIKDDYDSLRKRYADLIASHSAAASKLELTQEEVARLKKQVEEVVQDRNGAIRERNGLKQQCTAAIRQWDSALRERNEAKESLSKVQQQRDEAMKEINQAMAVRIKASKDLARLNEERNAAVQEYTLIMSERDSVHKEIEKLQEELSECNGKVKGLEAQKKASFEEVETLRREIASALHDRDKALKQCHDLREKYGDYETSRGDGSTERDDLSKDYDYYRRDRDGTHNKTRSAVVDHTKLNESKAQKERVDNLDQANQEIDRLRKMSEKLQSELDEALQEAEVSKRRRDWAFSERDKIVQERESIRTLCDKLRRERDRAVSDLAEALRDSDDIKKQRNEASKELKDLREKIEAQMEKESRLKHLNSIGHNHSRDSAIDADLQEWETETLEVEMPALNDDELMFDLAGGKDDPHFPESSVYISSIMKGSAADGKLKINDSIVRVNNIDLTATDRRTAIDTIRSCEGGINLVIRRRRLTSSRFIQSIHLNVTGGKEHGLHLETGVYVSRITPGSVAAKEGNVALGDRVVNVNGRFIDGMWSGIEAMKLLDSVGDCLVLSLLKCVNIPSAPLSSSSSGHNLQENGETEKSASPKPYIVSGSPLKEQNQNCCREGLKKLITSSSQTEDSFVSSPKNGIDFVKKREVEKSNGNRSSQHTFLDKLFGDHRSTKERVKEKFSWNSTPAPLQEEAVIAELDSVIEHFKKNTGSKSGKTRKKSEKDQEKNGGTWPKYRGPPLEYKEPCPGTMMHRRKKERVSITSLLNAPKLPASFYETSKKMEQHERNHDREVHRREMMIDHEGSRSSRRSSVSSNVGNSERERSGFNVYNSESNHGPSSLPPQSVSSAMNPLPVIQQLKSSGHYLSSPKSSSFHPPTNSSRMPDGGKNSSPVHYSGSSSFEFPLDYSVVSANRDKEVLEYYKNKNKARPKSAMYLPSDTERFLSSDGSLQPKPPSLDIQSIYKPVGHLSRSQLSPTDPMNLSPQLTERSVLHQRAPSQPTYASSGIDHQPSSSLLHSSANVTSYYTVGGSRVLHNHPIHSHPHGNMTSASSSSSAGVESSSPSYSSPPTLPYMSRSGESLLGGSIPEASPLPEARVYHHRYSINPSLSPSPSHYNNYGHSPSHSMELPHFHPVAVAPKRMMPTHSHPTPSYRGSDIVGFGSYDGPSTIPKRSHYRIRIPSNQSVTSKSSAGKVSTGSIERGEFQPDWVSSVHSWRVSGVDVACSSGVVWSPPRSSASTSDRSSPMPAFHVETITPGGTVVQRSICDFQNKKPSPGELRNIRINKSAEETLGIQIDCGPRGGIFVSSVSENSLAAQAGINIGDQLLEVCGINMRSATYLLAANVLRQCGDSVTMLVQYNPEKYRESLGTSESSSSSSGGGPDSPVNTPTPRSSPKSIRSPSQILDLDDSLPASATSTLKRKNTLVNTNSKDEQVSGDIYEPRFVFIKTITSNLGITFLGGNAVGIFVHKVQPESPASGPNGLRCGDQILEYNGIDLRQATAEQAAYELAKRAETITILAQYNIDRYTEIQHLPGDSLFIRAMFDHISENPNELSFHKDDILYVDNTMFNGVSGLWRAWIVDEDGHKKMCGVIPSKYKVEEDLLLRRSLGELDSESGSRRSAMSARRSFFRRYRKHQRSNSRDSKELASFSDVSINSYSDSGTLIEDPPISTYQRVERLDSDLVPRPVLILGPLIDVVVDKLVQDFPHKFARCIPEVMNASLQSMEKGLQENIYIDYRRRGSHFECITLASIKEICDKTCHCIIDANPMAAERLHKLQIYPIVLFIKFKSTKQIREVKDPRLVSEKVTTKAAKEIYDHSLRLENEYKHLITATIPGGNLAYMCAQIKAQVDQEQSKTLWVPAGSI